MLRTALGPAIAAFLEDPAIVEVMLNPDGRLWVDRLSEGLADTADPGDTIRNDTVRRRHSEPPGWTRLMAGSVAGHDKGGPMTASYKSSL